MPLCIDFVLIDLIYHCIIIAANRAKIIVVSVSQYLMCFDTHSCYVWLVLIFFEFGIALREQILHGLCI
jgi:hypothetical protein